MYKFNPQYFSYYKNCTQPFGREHLKSYSYSPGFFQDNTTLNAVSENGFFNSIAPILKVDDWIDVNCYDGSASFLVNETWTDVILDKTNISIICKNN